MSYLFDGSAEDLMGSALDALAHAAEGGPARETRFHDALVALVGLYERSARAGAPSSERQAAFRRDSAQALAGFPDLLSYYASDARNLAEDANDNEWPELCMRRSAIQVLLDDYPEVATAIDRDDVAELDEEMRRVGEDQGPLPAIAVPPGLPAGHWWWHHPQAVPFGPASGVRVLDPALAYATLRDRLEGAGWRNKDVSRQPIVPGEPEFALFEAGDGTHLAYSFNPVCRLRLLDGPAAPAPGGGDLLPPVAPEQVLDWLRGPDERTLLRGILAARQMPTPSLRERVDILRHHPHATIAKAAGEAAQAMDAVQTADTVREERKEMAAPPAGEENARNRALATIELLEQQLEPLLRALGQDRDGRLAAGLSPRPEDYARAFLPEAVEAARQGYTALWTSPPRVTAAAADSRLELHVAPAGMLADNNELSWHFPGGYRAIAHLLDPHRVWVAWKLISPGQSAGMAYDGLVWLDDHWAWFPKPYKMLAQLVR